MSVRVNFTKPFTSLANIHPPGFSPLASLSGGGRGKITIWWFCLYSTAKGEGGRESKINRCFSPGTPKAKEAKKKRSSRPLLVRFSSNILFPEKREFMCQDTPPAAAAAAKQTNQRGLNHSLRRNFPSFFNPFVFALMEHFRASHSLLLYYTAVCGVVYLEDEIKMGCPPNQPFPSPSKGRIKEDYFSSTSARWAIIRN